MLLTIDYETYYAHDYHLGNGGLKRTEYCHDERFKVHGAAVSLDFSPSVWITAKKLPGFFREIEKEVTHMMCFNGLFDHYITYLEYMSKEVFLLDPMSMAQGYLSTQHPTLGMSLGSLGKFCFPNDPSMHKWEGWLDESKGVRDLPPDMEARTGQYSCQDNKVCMGIFKWLLQQPYPWQEELVNIHLTLAMGVYPQLRMDTLRAAAIHAEEVRAKAEAVAQLNVSREALRSGAQFAALLEEAGAVVPMKENDKGNLVYAFAKTDEGMKELLEHENPRVQALAEARLGEKANQKESRAATFARLPEDLPIPLRHGAAHTGRHGGDEYNMQNLGRKSALRGCVKARKGHKVLVRDLSQIELRMSAWWCDEHWLVDLLRAGGDPYCVLATMIYGKEIRQKFKDEQDYPFEDERFVGKQGELSCGYQAGDDRVLSMLKQKGVTWADAALAKKVKTSFRNKHLATVSTWKWLQDKALPVVAGFGEPFEHKGVRFEAGRVVLPSGRSLWYPELHVNEHGDWVYRVNPRRNKGVTWKKIFGGAFLENIIQAMSYDVFMFHARLAWLSDKLRIAMAVHDEMVFSVPEINVVWADKTIAMIQTIAPAWCEGIPLKGEGGYGDNYLEAKV